MLNQRKSLKDINIIFYQGTCLFFLFEVHLTVQTVFKGKLYFIFSYIIIRFLVEYFILFLQLSLYMEYAGLGFPVNSCIASPF